MLATVLYCTGPFSFPSRYGADYTIYRQDGLGPGVYQRRGQKGKQLAGLSSNEKVTVHGITINHTDYYVTTADGVSGWVISEAFPKDGKEILFSAAQTGGETIEHFAHDREVEKLGDKYMRREDDYYAKFSMPQSTLNGPGSFRVNVETPFQHLTGKEYQALLKQHKKEKWLPIEMRTFDDKVVLSHVIYKEDCTMVYLTFTHTYSNVSRNDNTFNFWGHYPLSGWGNTAEWRTHLVVTDLDSGEKWYVMPHDYRLTDDRKEQTSDNVYTSGITFFFPPFASRHFSLTHDGLFPVPAFISINQIVDLTILTTLVSSGGSWDFLDYNFPEVIVR